MTIADDIQGFLAQNRDAEYQKFQAKLIPSIEPDSIIGVRTPALRSFAKQLAKRPDVEEFLTAVPHRTFEENQLHAFIISSRGSVDQMAAAIENFLPYVDNWATCDQMSPRKLGKDPARAQQLALKWMGSAHPYTVRYGIGVLMQLFLDEHFQLRQMQAVADLRSEEYYVNMMRAWYFAEALAKQPASALPFIEKGQLDTWTHNKAIQKAIESRRITSEQKAHLRTLRRQ